MVHPYTYRQICCTSNVQRATYSLTDFDHLIANNHCQNNFKAEKSPWICKSERERKKTEIPDTNIDNMYYCILRNCHCFGCPIKIHCAKCNAIHLNVKHSKLIDNSFVIVVITFCCCCFLFHRFYFVWFRLCTDSKQT